MKARVRLANKCAARLLLGTLQRVPLDVGEPLRDSDEPILDTSIGAPQKRYGPEVKGDADRDQPAEGEEGDCVPATCACCLRSESFHAAYSRPLMKATLMMTKPIIPAAASVVMRTSASGVK